MSLIAVIQSLLAQEEIKYLPDGPDALKLVSRDPDNVYGYIKVHEKDRTIIINAAAPLTAPHEKRPQLAELLARANWYIPFGNLQIHWDSGLITFKTSVILGSSDCHPDLFYAPLLQNLWEMARWFPAIEAVIIAGLSPERAVNMIVPESQPHDENNENGTDAFGRHLRDIQSGSMN